jgi:iron complex outermembrane receptor protein
MFILDVRVCGIRAARARRQFAATVLAGFLSTALSPFVHAQNSAGGQPSGPVTVQHPPVLVTAQKEPADPQGLPVGVTTVTGQTIDDAGVEIVSDAGVYAPNVHFTEFTARKLSNPRFRGIGASPSNPAITTYLDGVPQLNSNTSSIDLLQIDQLEFVRGPESPLFGRNTLGGVINVNSRRPSLGGDWTGSALVPFSNSDGIGVRAAASGPIVADKLGAGVAFSYGERDGFTQNAVTGNLLDSRQAYAWKGQVLWTPTAAFDARVIVSGERDRDGDYALSDLAGLRANPFVAAHDYEGSTERDITNVTVLARWDTRHVSLSSTTGFVDWRTQDATDLDYLPLPLATRNNLEEAFQFTQEVRVASPARMPVGLGKGASLRWQAGVFLFTQNYDQNATNNFAPFVLSPLVSIPVAVTSPQSALDDVGVGFYGQGTVSLGSRFDLIAGVRADYEQKDATLMTFTTPAIFPANSVVADQNFSDVSPQFAGVVRVSPSTMVYGSLARGFKAGGFNPNSPPGLEGYDQEHTWSLEGGVKTTLAGGRVVTNASVFRTDWQDLQLNLPNPFAPGDFYIDNAGSAVSSGVELEASGRVFAGVDVFGSLGYTHARFDEGVVIGLTNVGGNEIPNTPDFTTAFGVQVSQIVRPGLTIYGRAEATSQGAFFYDEANTQSQDTYWLTNLRGGARFGLVMVEAWVKNAFDTEYIPTAFVYPFAPSGFIGEMGRPRTFGLNVGVAF